MGSLLGALAVITWIAASPAEAGRGGHGGGGRVVVRSGGGGYSGGGRVVVRHVPDRVVVTGRTVPRYYDRSLRPAVIREYYTNRPGYYWVPGRWDWNGAEWIWYPGHYEPDPNYVVVQRGYGY